MDIYGLEWTALCPFLSIFVHAGPLFIDFLNSYRYSYLNLK